MSERDLLIRIVAETNQAKQNLEGLKGALSNTRDNARNAEASAKKLGESFDRAGTNARGLSDKLNALSGVGVPGLGRLAGAFQGAEAAGAAFGKTSLAATLAIGGASVAAAGLAVGLFKAVSAASEGEQATVRLTAALKAQGLYSEQAVESVGAWAEALLRTKGVNDELAATLVAQGVTMGISIQRTQEFVSIAADMAPVMGSIEMAFEAVARAAQGDTRALQTLGKQFGIVTTESSKFELVLAEIQKKVDGNAAAQVNTFAGQWGLLSGQVGNFMESAGTPLLRVLTDVARALTTGAETARKMGEEVERMNGPKMREMIALGLMLTGQSNLAVMALGSGAGEKSGGGLPSVMQSSHGFYSVPGEVASHETTYLPDRIKRKADGTFESTNQVSGNYSNFLDRVKEQEKAEDEAKRRAEEATQFAENQEKLRLESAEQALEDNAQLHRDYFLATNLAEDYARKETEKREAERYAKAKQQIEDNLDALREYFLLSNQIEAIEKAERTSSAAQERLTGGKQYGPIYNPIIGETSTGLKLRWEQQQKLQNELTQVTDEKRQAEELAEKTKALYDFKLETMRQEMELAQGITNAIVGVIKGGDVGQGIRGIGASLTSAGLIENQQYSSAVQTAGSTISALSMGTGAAIGNVIGGIIGGVVAGIYSEGALWSVGASVGSGVGQAIGGLFDSSDAKSENPKSSAEAQIRSYIEAYTPNLPYQRTYITNPDGTQSAQQYKARQWDMDDLGVTTAWSNLIGGSNSTGMSMKDWLADLGLTMGQAATQVAKLVAAAKGMDEFEALRMVSFEAFTAKGTLSREEMFDVTEGYAVGKAGYERRQDLTNRAEEIFEEIAAGGGVASDAQIDELMSIDKELDGLALPTERTAAATEDSADYLKQLVTLAGGTPTTRDKTTTPEPPDLPDPHSGQFPVYHSGRFGALDRNERMAIVHNDELIAPPSRFREASEYLAARGYGGGGGGVTIHVSGAVGNHRDLARLIKREMSRNEIRREVAA